MQFAWTATGTVTVDLDEREHTFIVVTEHETREYGVDAAMKGLLNLSQGEKVQLELITLEPLGPVAIHS